MRIIIALTLILIAVSACSPLPLTAYGSQPTDSYAKLPSHDGGSFVSCTSDTDCSQYLANYGVNINSQCRDRICYYEAKPEFSQVGGE